MSDLEARYSTVLYWYPATWREQNADAVVGTLMDEADAAGRTRPRPAELASLAVNGIRARLASVLSAPPTLAIRRVIADLAFALGFVVSLVMAIGFEWAPWAPQAWREWPPAAGVAFGPFASAGVILFMLWIAGFALALAGYRRVARGVAALSVPLGLVFVALRPDGRWAIYPPTENPALALVPSTGAVLFLAALAAFSCLTPRVERADRARNAAGLAAAAGAALVYVVVAIGNDANWSLSSHTMFGMPGYEGRLWRSSAWIAIADLPLLAMFIVIAVAISSGASILIAIGRRRLAERRLQS